jgi:hypothetical protein
MMKRWLMLVLCAVLCLPALVVAEQEGGEAAAVVAEDPTDAAAPEMLLAQAPAARGAARNPQMATQIAGELADALAGALLENIVVGQSADGEWFISVENRTYRSDLQAATAALKAVAARVPGAGVTLQLKRDNVPVVSVTVNLDDLARLASGALPPEDLSYRWSVSPGQRGAAGPERVLAQRQSSYGKVDVAVRPAIRYRIGDIPDPFESDYFLTTNADTTLSAGWHANLESSTRLTSGMRNVLERATVSHTRWLSPKLLGTATAGRLRPGLYGVYSEVQWDERQHRFGVAGRLISDDASLSDSVIHGVGYYEYEVGRLGLTARLAGGRFMESKKEGVALSLRRQFGESVLTAEAVRNRGGKDGIVVGLTVPMGPEAVDPPATLRLRPDPAFRISYRSNFAAQGDYLQGDYDLRNFRSELTAPYLQAHPQRLTGQGRPPAPVESWPVAPSHEGTSGLLRIPTADVNRDGRIATGISYVDRAHSKIKNNTTSSMPVYISLGFLPNLELIGRLTFMHDRKAFNWPYGTDRSFHLHYRLLSQQGNRPAVAVGLQDFGFASESLVVGKAEYVVGTWQKDRYRVHLGGGRHRLSGLFGGVDWDVLGGHKLHLMAEYDTTNINAGARVFLGSRCSFDIGAQDLSKLSGAFTFRTDLR